MFAKLYVTSLLLLKCMYLLRSYVLCSYVLRSSTIVEGSIYCYKTRLLSAWPPWCNGYNTHLETEGSTDRIPANPARVFTLAFIDISMQKKIGRKERMLAGRNEKFPPANILSFLPSHYNDYHAFVSSTEHGFFRILGEMSLRGQETHFLPSEQHYT